MVEQTRKTQRDVLTTEVTFGGSYLDGLEKSRHGIFHQFANPDVTFTGDEFTLLNGDLRTIEAYVIHPNLTRDQAGRITNSNRLERKVYVRNNSDGTVYEVVDLDSSGKNLTRNLYTLSELSDLHQNSRL